MSKKREYPLELFDLIDLDNGGRTGIASKGHHDVDAFIAAIAQYDGDIVVEPCDVKHMWVRLVPTGEPPEDAFDDAVQGQRGAFPLTRVSVWRIFDEPMKRDHS